MTWNPISKEELLGEVQKGAAQMTDEQLAFWKQIVISPKKWKESEHGKEGNGFWAVALHQNYVIWYNDIEEGFNISLFSKKGIINEYAAEQDELQWTLGKFIKLLDSRVLYKRIEHLKLSFMWSREWVHFGTGEEIKIELVKNVIQKLMGDIVYLIIERSNSKEVKKKEIYQSIDNLLGHKNFEIWNQELNHAIQFHQMGVFTEGKSIS